MTGRLLPLLVMLLASFSAVYGQVKSVTVTPTLTQVGQPIACKVDAANAGTVTVDEEEITWNAVEQQWDFGDENIADTLTAKHSYADPGEYLVLSTTVFLLDDEPVAFHDAEFTVTVLEALPTRLQVTLRESWSHTPSKVTFREDGESFSEIIETEKGSFTLTAVLSLNGLTEPLGADSEFGLSAGNVDIAGTLGDLGEAMGGTGTFRTGRATAKLQEDIGEERSKLVTVQTLSVSFNSKQAMIKLTGKLHPAEVGDTLAADNAEETGSFELPVALLLGNIELTLPVQVAARVKVTTKRFKIDGETEEAEAISKALIGKYSFKAITPKP